MIFENMDAIKSFDKIITGLLGLELARKKKMDAIFI
jgi:hypothetical protein